MDYAPYVCDKACGNRTSYGYCKTSYCIYPFQFAGQVSAIPMNDLPKVLEKETLKLVFCKDCEHYIKHDKRCAVWNHGVHKDDYCSRGQKKEVEE